MATSRLHQGMLYFLDEKPGGSWADGTLKALGYDSNPEKLQTVMRRSGQVLGRREVVSVLEIRDEI